MSARAYAVVSDLGVLWIDRQLLVYPRRADAARAKSRLLSRGDIEPDECRIEPVSIARSDAKESR